MEKRNSNMSDYLDFLAFAVHLSKKYNLKFQKKLYQDLLDSYFYKKNHKIINNVFINESYLNYDDLNELYKYTKDKCNENNCDNIIKYGYVYSCYKLKKEKRKDIVLMILDEDFLKYSCNDNISNNYDDRYKYYEQKDIKVYENNFYNVKCMPGYSIGYYLLGKIYEKELKEEWFDERKKKVLIDISFYCYYLCFKSCPFLICSLRKLLMLYGKFYCNNMYMEEVRKVSKFYNFEIDIYKKWKNRSLNHNKDGEEDMKENFDNSIIELIDLKQIKVININNCDFILSLIEEENINRYFLEWTDHFKDHVNENICKVNNIISKIGINDLIVIGKFYFYFYINNFKRCLMILEEWRNEPIFSICIFYIKGLCYFFLRNYEKSIIFFEVIQDIDCYFTKHLPFLSTCYWHKKDIEKIEYILTDYPKRKLNEHFLCVIGNYFSLKNKKEIAASFFRKAIQLNIYYEYSYILYSCETKYLGETQKSALALAKCLKINPCNFKAHLLLSIILFEERSFELCNFHLSLCLKLNNTDGLICLYLASIYNYSGKYESALLCLKHAEENIYNKIELFIMQGIIFLKIKRNVDALNSFLKAQKINPKCNYINTLVAFTLVLENKFETAKKIIKEMILESSQDVNKNMLKYIYKCCDLKTASSDCVLNKIEHFLMDRNFRDIYAFENSLLE
ncbi:anaphase-promoting complex subunit 3, putative [Plasmodium chabaudi chabaudi]|uniref:Anaphase-promoting complex subunit 3, putative n=1 Tax=Plasmodium chabaudi chabaudi TaxID=31271 RepID=A0A077TPE0_PLACU|nr:anaphase-promoting complex subunit 3, putative [Plasmodium chabaudi chabaudi]SCM23245.1 anaphase-promoting complex subunit, putative [Plasmodium chabaudi chabaudi]VTZ69008.1 anaphase-promoting complex subunit 3, putative [Plasmodium chabaudi chabaudi]|eukprot:XP_016653901.1 anaphase-promoting complex subunit, putative [Plasmodium chabaudi chabaudi]